MGSIVLAGGRSSRMGRDKALLEYAGVRLLDRVVRIVGSVALPVVVVAESAGRYGSVAGACVVGDTYPGAGPLGGLVTGLAALGDGFHLAVACDMPTLVPALLARLVVLADEADAVIPEIGGRLEPLCAAYRASCADRLQSRLEAGERALHRAVRSLHLRIVSESEARALDPELASFANVNTPEEYGRAISP